MKKIPALDISAAQFICSLCHNFGAKDKFKVVITQHKDDGFACKPTIECLRLNNSKFKTADTGRFVYALQKFSEANRDWAFFWLPFRNGQNGFISFPPEDDPIPASVADAFASAKGVTRIYSGMALELVIDLPALHARLVAQYPELAGKDSLTLWVSESQAATQVVKNPATVYPFQHKSVETLGELRALLRDLPDNTSLQHNAQEAWVLTARLTTPAESADIQAQLEVHICNG